MGVRLCGWSAILFVFAIFFFVFREGAPVLFKELDLKEFLTSVNWRPDSTIRPQFGILALLVGTASVTALAMAVSVPAGFASAIFISEFCGPKAREALKIIIELLVAIPSVVWGFIGYMVLDPVIIWTTGAPIGINILNGGIILALMSVPIIMSVPNRFLTDGASPSMRWLHGNGAHSQPQASISIVAFQSRLAEVPARPWQR